MKASGDLGQRRQPSRDATVVKGCGLRTKNRSDMTKKELLATLADYYSAHKSTYDRYQVSLESFLKLHSDLADAMYVEGMPEDYIQGCVLKERGNFMLVHKYQVSARDVAKRFR